MIKVVRDVDIGKGLEINDADGHKVEVVASKAKGNIAVIKSDGVYVPQGAGDCNCAMEPYQGDLSDFALTNMIDSSGLVHKVYKRFRHTIQVHSHTISFDDVSERPASDDEYNANPSMNWILRDNVVITKGNLNISLTTNTADVSSVVANQPSISVLNIMQDMDQYERMIGYDNAVVNVVDNNDGTSTVSITIPNVTYILNKNGEYSRLYSQASSGFINNYTDTEFVRLELPNSDGLNAVISIINNSNGIPSTVA